MSGSAICYSRRELARNDQGKCGTTSDAAFERHPAAEQHRQLAGKGKTEASTSNSPLDRPINLRELLEDPLLVFGCNAGACVAYEETHLVAHGLHANPYFARD